MWRNISEKTLVFPSGKTVKPGDTFATKHAAGVGLRALELGRTIISVPKPPKPKRKGK